MRFVVGEILPLALVVTISPINVIPVILLLFTTRPLFNALCYLAGFIAGVASLLGACVATAGTVNLSPSSNHSRGQTSSNWPSSVPFGGWGPKAPWSASGRRSTLPLGVVTRTVSLHHREIISSRPPVIGAQPDHRHDHDDAIVWCRAPAGRAPR